jgi:large subunit ribosomal protein L25
MAEFILEANERQVDKQSQLTDIRTSSRVPGVIYGFSQKPISIEADYQKLLKVLKDAGTSNLVTIKISNKEIKTIVREFQQDPVSDRITHVDFMAVDEKKPIFTKVPLEFIGMSKLVREQGAQLNKKAETVDVKCLPADLPAKIEVDISVLTEVGQKLLISDLKKINERVTITNDPNNPVASITMPKLAQTKEGAAVKEAATVEAPTEAPVANEEKK